MNRLLANLSANLVSLACVIIAGHLVMHDKPGLAWGWFLGVGFLTTAWYSDRRKKDETDEEDDGK